MQRFYKEERGEGVQAGGVCVCKTTNQCLRIVITVIITRIFALSR